MQRNASTDECQIVKDVLELPITETSLGRSKKPGSFRFLDWNYKILHEAILSIVQISTSK